MKIYNYDGNGKLIGSTERRTFGDDVNDVGNMIVVSICIVVFLFALSQVCSWF